LKGRVFSCVEVFSDEAPPYNFLDASSHNNGNVMGITHNRDTTRSQSLSYDSLNRIGGWRNLTARCQQSTRIQCQAHLNTEETYVECFTTAYSVVN
jgi:hypothetical protein